MKKDALYVKCILIEALKTELDEPLRDHGFSRSAKSVIYTRSFQESKQELAFNTGSFPRYKRGADAHLLPAFYWISKSIKQRSLELVEGNSILVAGTSNVILNHPFQWLAPKEYYTDWYATGPEEFSISCRNIRDFLFKWVLPFVDKACSYADLVNLYEQNDSRMLKQPHTYVYIIAAYQILGEEEKAREVVLKHFSKPGSKSLYKVLFKSLGLE